MVWQRQRVLRNVWANLTAPERELFWTWCGAFVAGLVSFLVITERLSFEGEVCPVCGPADFYESEEGTNFVRAIGEEVSQEAHRHGRVLRLKF